MNKLNPENTAKNHETYQFSLLLAGVDETTPNLENALFNAGCDDALINYKNGAVVLDFDRWKPCLCKVLAGRYFWKS